MMKRIALIHWFVAILPAFMSVQLAAADDFRKVNPAKYERGAPLKGYSFERKKPLQEFGPEAFPKGVYEVMYRTDNGYALYGILDERGKRAKWLLKPHYQILRDFGPGMFAARATGSRDSTYCILLMNADACTPTNYVNLTPATYRDFQKLPDWVHDKVLFNWTDRTSVVDVQFFSPTGEPLIEIKNVMRGWLQKRKYRRREDDHIKVFDLNGSLVIRTSPAEGQVVDVVLHRHADGSITQRTVPPFSILEYDDGHPTIVNGRADLLAPRIEYADLELMFTADPTLGLVWPFYPTESGFKPAPADLLGLMPLSFEFPNYRSYSSRFGDSTSAAHFCCDMPLAWVVAWETPQGISYALLRQAFVPEYDTVMASRSEAIYTDIETLWRPDANLSRLLEKARSEGQLIGKYALHRRDGDIEIISGYIYGASQGETIKSEEFVSPSNFSDWKVRNIREAASQRAAYHATIEQIERQKQAQKRATEAAWAAARRQAAAANAARQSERAQARQKRAAQMRAFEEEEARKAAEYRAQANSTPHPDAFWNAWQTDGINDVGSSSGRSTAPVDYWKSYDSTNTTGQYTTSSGAATGCKIGDPNC